MGILKKAALVAAFSSLNCSDKTCYPDYRFGRFTSYSISRTSTLNSGVGLDDPRSELDGIKIDKTILNVANCVSNIADSGLTDDEYSKGECYYRTIDATIRSCLTIKVAPDWKISQCTGEQIFPCAVGDFRCQEKGQTPTTQCPCSCRGIIQDNAIVITPNMRLLPAQLVTMMTGCLSPWVGRLAECSSSNQIGK